MSDIEAWKGITKSFWIESHADHGTCVWPVNTCGQQRNTFLSQNLPPDPLHGVGEKGSSVVLNGLTDHGTCVRPVNFCGQHRSTPKIFPQNLPPDPLHGVGEMGSAVVLNAQAES